MNYKKEFLLSEVPTLLQDLTPDSKRAFGLMSPQHMVEHLIWVTKSSVKDFGPPPKEFTDPQKGFMKFVNKGAYFLHRPTKDDKDKLASLRMSSLEEAVNEIPAALSRLYNHDKGHTFYNPAMGMLSFEDMEHFHYMHFKYHLQHQFGLGLYRHK